MSTLLSILDIVDVDKHEIEKDMRYKNKPRSFWLQEKFGQPDSQLGLCRAYQQSDRPTFTTWHGTAWS